MSHQPSPGQAVQEASLASDELPSLTAPEARELAAVAVAAAPATQVRRPWRATVRTVFQLLVGLAAMLPLLADAAGLEETTPVLAGALAVSAAVTRVMALPAVEAFLESFVPFLAASPRSHG